MADSSEAIESLLSTFGEDETRERITRRKFVSGLTSSLGMDESVAEERWSHLVKMCRTTTAAVVAPGGGGDDGGAAKSDGPSSLSSDDDDAATAEVVESLTRSDLDLLYGTPEYNPEISAVALMDKLKNLFRALDSDDDGLVTASDLAVGINTTLLPPEQRGGGDDVTIETAQAILSAADEDGSGKIDLAEFVSAVLKVDPNSFSHVRRKALDQSGKGDDKIQVSTVRKRVFIGSRLDKDKMKRSLDLVLNDETFGRRWLIGLFEAYPETRVLFANDINCNVSPFLKMLGKIIAKADSFEEMMPRLQRLGVKHIQMGIKYEYFEHLLYAMLETFADDVTSEEKQMWVDLFAIIYFTFMEAAKFPDLMADEKLLVGNVVEGEHENPMLDPNESPPEEFVRFLTGLAETHAAVTHSYLSRMADGDLPLVDRALVDFAEEYRHYGGRFVKYVEMLLEDGVDGESEANVQDADGQTEGRAILSAEHRALLEQDLAEEQGAPLDEDDRAMLQSLGVDADAVDGVPHKELFRRMRRRIREACGADGVDGAETRPGGPGGRFADDVESILKRSDRSARIAALGIGIESIVPMVYESILSAVRGATDLGPDDYAFLLLHANVDVRHGKTMQQIVVDLAKDSMDVRIGILEAVRATLDARVRLWDGLLSRNLNAYLRKHEAEAEAEEKEEADSGRCPVLGERQRSRRSLAADEGGEGTKSSGCPVTGGGAADSSPSEGEEQTPEEPQELYDTNSTSWSRSEPNCLSDFTARPAVFELCRPHASEEGSWILDLGCGEGYCARKLRELFGPRQIVGVDVSESMIELARAAEEENGRQRRRNSAIGSGGGDGNGGELDRTTTLRYFHGDAREVRSLLGGQSLELGLANRAAVDGRFQLVVAVFLFNYMSIQDMRDVGEQVYQLLQPWGRFVFSVPHPSLKYWGREPTPPFHLNAEGLNGYFRDRDERYSGFIYRKDGQRLPIQSVHKTFEDYISFLCDLGFVIESVTELGADPELVAQDPEFFGGVDGVPLHVAVKAMKPDSKVGVALDAARESGAVEQKAAAVPAKRGERSKTKKLSNLIADSSAIEQRHDEFLVPPKEVLWSCFDHGDRFVLRMSDGVVGELVDSAKSCLARGIDHTTYKPGDVWPMNNVKRFAHECAERLMRQHGNLIVRGLDVDSLADTEEEREKVAKLCYYILMSSTGTVNVTRGRLFDVMDRHLDAKKDNVLFSACSQECGWHSDGSSRDWFPDMVNLLCLRPAAEGGEFQIANACNAFHDLRARLPAFLMYELTRPLVRDILEKGAKHGFGNKALGDDPSSFWVALSRRPDILRQRLRLNSFPIYDRNELTGQSKFRFIDQWLRSGHDKAGLRFSPLLEIAIKELDDALHGQCRFDRRLERGEIAMANNHLVAHRRDAFQDRDGATEYQRRKLVRCWLTIK